MTAVMDGIDTTAREIATEQWVRNASDTSAVINGCRFDAERAAYTVWWIEHYLRLYEGEHAGEPLILRGCGECSYDLPLSSDYDWDETGIEIATARADLYCDCVAAGHQLDWQYECTMRMFGWVRWSEHWQQEIRRFRKASIWVAKKNKKSPTLAAWAMYLTSGDGEPGQHVFLGAKDGAQARENTAKHCVEMLIQSPELQAECTLNKASLQILHESSRSTLRPLSSSNVRTQKSKEGLNGSVLIDETHVVDREFVSRIDRAGISRMEPVHGEFSTAGDDPDSYGNEQNQRALKTEAGEVEDQELFAAVYAAPQDLTDEDLDADPLLYGRMANPSMGHTVNPEEFLADYRASREAPAKLAQFKMYRLNIWQNSASPWLRMECWDKGRQDFEAESLHGRECWAALDLASVCDFASLCLAFPEADEAVRFLWWFWLPEDTARKVSHLIDIHKWKADKRTQLFLTPGARIDYGYIRSQFRELHGLYKINELAYDDWNAEQTTQELSEGVRDSGGRVIEPGTGVPRVNFSQGIKTMNEPTKQFEARVIDGKILHNGDPLMRWMVGNATIKPDVNGNYKPLKPRDGTKKIDGVIVGIMALARVAMGDVGVYDYTAGSMSL